MRLAFSITLFLISLSLWSQTFNGRIVDEGDKKPVASVSVSIVDGEGRALCYTIGDDKGYFSINLAEPKGATGIYISSLGYEARQININEFKNGSVIHLSKSDIVLKEVIVKYQPIKQRGDTLNYDVRGFKLAQDRHIKDVLKRLPGIEVADDGRISYEGKAINKFYVENLDVSDGKYNLITNNLAAKSVKTVQVLENHQPITSLRDIDISEKAALNLVLEDDFKNKVMASLDLGVGIENSLSEPIWENRILTLLFHKKRQNVSVYKNSNTGTDIKEDLIDFGTSSVASVRYASSKIDEIDIFSPLNNTSTNQTFSKDKYFFNDTHLFTINHLVKLSKDKTFRVQASFLHEKLNQQSESATTYFLPEGTLLIKEKINVKDIKNRIDGRFNYNSNTEKTFLNNTLNISSLFNNNDGIVIGTNDINQRMELDKLQLSNEFNIIHRIGKKTIRFTSVNTYNSLPQNISVTPGLYLQLTGENIDERMTQNAKLKSFYSHSYTSFSHSLCGFYIEYNTGLKLKTQLLKSASDEKTSNLLGLFADSLSNHFRFTETDVYIAPAISFQRPTINIKLTLSSTLKNLYRNEMLSQASNQSKTKFIFEPSLSFTYDVNAYLRMRIGSGYNENYSDIYSLYTGYILKSYRYISNQKNDIVFNKNYNNSLSLFYKNPIKGIFINGMGMYSVRKRNTLSKTVFNGILQQSTNITKNVTDNSLSTYFSISKVLPFWSSTVNFRYNFFDADNTQIIMDILTKNNTKMHGFDLSFTLQPFKKLNFEGRANLSIIQMKTTSPEEKKYAPIHDYDFKLNVNYIPSKSIKLSFDNNIYYNTSENAPVLYFADISLSYSFKRSEIQLSGNNIFNKNKYQKRNFGSFSEAYDIIFLHERQFMLKYMFDF